MDLADIRLSERSQTQTVGTYDYLYEVQEQTNVICADRSQNGKWVLTGAPGKLLG